LKLATNKAKSRAAKDTIRVGRGSRSVQKVARGLTINTRSLCNEELYQLVLQITEGGHRSKLFLRRMVILWDSLKAGETNKVIQFARQNKDPAFAKLMAAISDSVREEDLAMASIIVFLAAGFAYQNTLDYYLDLTSYLDRFRSSKDKPSR